jgi:hypothetical protein
VAGVSIGEGVKRHARADVPTWAVIAGGIMPGTHRAGTCAADSKRQWAELDSCNERLVEASHPLLLKEAKPEADHQPAVAADAGR